MLQKNYPEVKYLFISILFLFTGYQNCQAQALGNGIDGSPNISGIINTYTSVTNVSITGCNSTITVDSILNFQAGDLVLIMQMNGALIDTTNSSAYGTILSYNNAGNFEFAKISSIVGLNISLTNKLVNSYSPSIGSVQLIKVPQYARPKITGTLTCKSWDGIKGGVLAIDATQSIRFTDSISLFRQGFRGGKVVNGTTFYPHQGYWTSTYNPTYYAAKGEGIAGYGMNGFYYAKGAPANGGGGGNVVNAGGGGGASYGCGGFGGQGFNYSFYGPNPSQAQGQGGYALPYSSSFQRLFLGGGGGAGQENDNVAYDAGNGGGIVIINADSIISIANASINVKGDSSADSNNDGGSGGGAGGVVLLHCNKYIGNLKINANGGDGANTNSSSGYDHGPGGGGGGGLVWFSLPTQPANVLINVNGGLQGTASGNNSLETDGCIGATLLNFNYLTTSGNITTTLLASICGTQNYTLPNGTIVNTSGIYNDTLTNHFGCDSIISVHLTQLPQNKITLQKAICEGSYYTLANGTKVNTAGIYIDTLINHFGCDSIIATQLSISQIPYVSLGTDTTLCLGNPIVLDVSTSQGTYHWNDLSTTGIKTITQSGLYTVLIQNPPCTAATDSILITYLDCDNCDIAIPNAFTPNADGKNDVFKVLTNCNITNFSLKIFNRWGQQVFETNDINFGWDGYYHGILQPISVFVYYVQITKASGDKKLIKGDVSLIR